MRRVVQCRMWYLGATGVDGTLTCESLGGAVPKIRELSKVPTVVFAQQQRSLRSLRVWLKWGLEQEEHWWCLQIHIYSGI